MRHYQTNPVIRIQVKSTTDITGVEGKCSFNFSAKKQNPNEKQCWSINLIPLDCVYAGTGQHQRSKCWTKLCIKSLHYSRSRRQAKENFTFWNAGFVYFYSYLKVYHPIILCVSPYQQHDSDGISNLATNTDKRVSKVQNRQKSGLVS
jgi:hypothetical protein